MKPTAKTIGLTLIALFLLGLNLMDGGTGHRISAQLPQLDALDRATVTRIEIATATQKIILERTAPPDPSATEATQRDIGTWELSAPFDAAADQVQVRSLLGLFRKDLPIDVQVDRGDLETYGLDASNGVVAEIWTDQTEPAVSFTVGKDGPAGSSFVRLHGDDAIYRARIGGQARWARPAIQWRNRVLLGFQGSQAQAIRIKHRTRTPFELMRTSSPGTQEDGTPIPGPWTLAPDPGWAVDQPRIEAMVQGLGSLRAGEILDRNNLDGLDNPLATIEVTLVDGVTHALEVSAKANQGGATVRRVADGEVARVAQSTIAPFLTPPDNLRDLTLFGFARSSVDTLTLEDSSGIVMLQQDLSSKLWRVLQPAGTDIDVKLVFFTVNTLATLRGDASSSLSPEEAGLDSPSTRITIQFLDGVSTTL